MAMRLLHYCAICLFAFFVWSIPQQSDALIVTASASNGFCTDQDGGVPGPISAVAACGGMSASASVGSLSVSSRTDAFASIGSTRTSSGDGGASASFSDRIYFSIGSGTFTIPLDFLGNLSVGVGTNVDATAGVGYNISAGAGGSVTPQGAAAFLTPQSSSGSSDTVTNAKFSFINGSIVINAFLQANTRCGAITLSPPRVTSAQCFAEANFSSSLRFLGGTVRTPEGTIVQNAYLGSDSGFDYLEGVAPHNRVSVIPLPATIWLYAAALSAFFAFGGRKRVSWRPAHS